MARMSSSPDLTLCGRPVATVFDLLGGSENDMTSSTGWALTRSPTLLRLLLAAVAPATKPGMFIGVRLQESSGLGGYTDIEIETENLFVIVEAKRGWQLPRRAQLELYAQRLQRREKQGVLAVLSECSREFAEPRLPKTIGQVPVCHLSWAEVVALGRAGARCAARAERPVLRDLCDYLEGLIHMQSQQSNLVYVVVIAEGSPPWSRIPWRDYVRVKSQYFHPYGRNGWPAVPPNYLGFRWGGRLRGIYHVEGYEIVDPLWGKVPEIERALRGENDGEFVLYQLGPAIEPPKVVKNGNIYATARLTAAIDLLLTCDTIAEAVRLTQERSGAM